MDLEVGTTPIGWKEALAIEGCHHLDPSMVHKAVKKAVEHNGLIKAQVATSSAIPRGHALLACGPSSATLRLEQGPMGVISPPIQL